MRAFGPGTLRQARVAVVMSHRPDGDRSVHAALTSLDEALASRCQRTSSWEVAGTRATARALDVTGARVLRIHAVVCDADGNATASLAREIAVLEYLAHQPSVLPLRHAGRHAGLVYAVLPCTDGMSLAARMQRDGPMCEDEVVHAMIAVADLLHFMHGAGIAHTAITPDTLFHLDGVVLLGGFHSARPLASALDAPKVIAADVRALARSACALLLQRSDGVADIALDDGDKGCIATHGIGAHCVVSAGLGAVLQRALGADAGACFQTAIAFAQAICAVRDASTEWGEVSARAADEAHDVIPLSDGVDRSLRVLHALLDRAEVEEEPPEPGDPLVQRCWDRAAAQVSPDDARLVALRVRWRLLVDRDPSGALAAAQPARDAAAVSPYRARALAALGRAADARTLAVRTWFDEVALDGAAMRSLTIALRLTRAFDLASLISVTECVAGSADPVLCAATCSPPPLRTQSARASAEAISRIAAAIDRRVPWTAALLVDPRWDMLRGHPQFADLVGRVRQQWTS